MAGKSWYCFQPNDDCKLRGCSASISLASNPFNYLLLFTIHWLFRSFSATVFTFVDFPTQFRMWIRAERKALRHSRCLAEKRRCEWRFGWTVNWRIIHHHENPQLIVISSIVPRFPEKSNRHDSFHSSLSYTVLRRPSRKMRIIRE